MGVDANDLGEVVGIIAKKNTALGLTLGSRISVTPSPSICFYLLLMRSS